MAEFSAEAEALFEAVRDGDIDMVNELIGQGTPLLSVCLGSV